jgi:hypothetical protein
MPLAVSRIYVIISINKIASTAEFRKPILRGKFRCHSAAEPLEFRCPPSHRFLK